MAATGQFNLKKALNVFGTTIDQLASRGVQESLLPPFSKSHAGNRGLKSWSLQDLPAVGEKIGFMKKPTSPLAIALFVTKGGVLKSSLTLNLARMAALHNIRTCVVGLDMQGDVTSSLGEENLDDNASFDDALIRMNSLRGLPDLFTGDSTLEDIILGTEIPTLSYIPETPELVSLDQNLIHRNRREYWLKEKVIAPLKENFDLILIDCSPNWNRLITNALVAADVLLSPLECKINNFRNFKAFKILLDEFKKDLQVDFQQIYVPTRLSPGRRLSQEIFQWYRSELADECVRGAVRESTQGEEATALRISLAEHAPTSAAGEELIDLMAEIWNKINQAGRKKYSAVESQRSEECRLV